MMITMLMMMLMMMMMMIRENNIYSYFEIAVYVIFSNHHHHLLSEKVHATIPKGIVGGFECSVLQRNLKKWHEGHGHMFASAKGEQQKYVRQLQSSGIMYWSYPILPFGIDACTFFPTTFLEIAVWFKTPACRSNRLALFNHYRGVKLATVEKHFQSVVKAVFKPRASGLPDWQHARLLGHASPKAKSRGALGHAAHSLQKRSTSSYKHKKQIFLRKSVRRQTYFHHPISRLHNP